MTMTEGEKMVWAAAFVDAMRSSPPEDEVGAARIATITVVEYLRRGVAKAEDTFSENDQEYIECLRSILE